MEREEREEQRRIERQESEQAHQRSMQTTMMMLGAIFGQGGRVKGKDE